MSLIHLPLLLRVYLLGGMALHKAVWGLMKRRERRHEATKERSWKTQVLSSTKLFILAAVIVETLLPDILPISVMPEAIRLAGLSLYTLGCAVAIIARIQLGRNWSDIEKSYVKEGHAVVAHGLYKYVRHPIYAGDLLLLVGLELALNSWLVAALIPLAIYVRQQAIREERKLLQTLPGYDRYFAGTARFFPFLPV